MKTSVRIANSLTQIQTEYSQNTRLQRVTATATCLFPNDNAFDVVTTYTEQYIQSAKELNRKLLQIYFEVTCLLGT